jgi:hypothetical protein
MNPVYLAWTSGGSSGPPSALEWALIAGGLVLPLGSVALVVFLIRRSRQTKITGPALTGTAQVLSVGSTGYSSKAAFDAYERHFRKIGLRVQIPGREPYDVTVWHGFAAWMLGTIQPGSSVPVQVDSTNPRNVRIDLSQPVQRRSQAGSSGSAEQFADQLKAALEEKLNQIPGVTVASDNSGSSGSPATVAALADAYKQSPGSVPVASAADLLASGQRVRGVLKSFAATGTTPRSLGRTPTRPELLDAPHYLLEVELQFPNLAPVTGRVVQPVPPAQVPNLAIGRELTCAVDQANTSHFVVDWNAIAD